MRPRSSIPWATATEGGPGMPDKRKPSTLGELKESGYQIVSVKHELRRNLIDRIKKGTELFPGIVGYQDTVIPQVENAILAGHDLIFLGERGQAKSRLIRQMVNLLDEEVPIVKGSEINDNPYAPVSKYARELVHGQGDKTVIEWIGRTQRYAEKLATPDITISDLIGEIDPIKVAEGRYLSDELAIHYGLIPRTNRGIICINELPDLAERIQVGLFNLLEERDIQIKGYRIQLPLDVYVVATANPEDYTNRGRIITPLKDRYGALIRTHYPKTIQEEIGIVEHEVNIYQDDDLKVTVPQYMKEVVADFTAIARKSPEINQRSGVSVRVSICNYETLVSNSLRRAIRLRESPAVPRITDLPYLLASTGGKVEMETVEEGRETRVLEDTVKKAVVTTFGRYFTASELDPLIHRFETGFVVDTSDTFSAHEYAKRFMEAPEMKNAVAKLTKDSTAPSIASAVEFILEGLHLNRRLNRDKVEGAYRYRS